MILVITKKKVVSFFIHAVSFLVFVAIFITCENNPTTTEERELPPELPSDLEGPLLHLESLIYPLEGADPTFDDSELQAFNQISNAKFIGLGESTHGTKEFFQMKHRLLKFFVENHDFRAFGIEADMGESIYINKIITGGDGDIQDEMSDKMRFWTWHTWEVHEMLAWMAEYNDGKGDDDKVYYVGFDCQSTLYQPKLIEDFFYKNFSTGLDSVKSILSWIKSVNKLSYNAAVNEYSQMPEAEFAGYLSRFDYIVQLIDDNSGMIIANSSQYLTEEIRQLIINLRQAVEVNYSYHNSGYSSINLRDKYMAENALWLEKLFGENEKFVLWAHNAHLADDPNYGYGGSMGHNLKNAVGDQYQIAGFSFCKGKFTAVGYSNGSYTGIQIQTITSNPVSDSYQELFQFTETDNFILFNKDISNGTELFNWMNQTRAFLAIGSLFNGNPEEYYRNVNVIDQFDILIHFDNTLSAVQIPRPQFIKRTIQNPDPFF